jgi:Contractile injection system tube protein/LysM domain
VPEAPSLQRARFVELDSEFKDVKPGGQEAAVQFNPETLKVAFANQIVQPSGGGDQRGQPARQFVGAGTTKLTLQLVIDVTAPPYVDQGKDDVRELTQQVAYFITPQPASGGGSAPPPSGGSSGSAASQTQLVPPGVRFLWGSFKFDGMMDSLDETLEFWSPDGKPLRATLAVGLSQQKITRFFDPNNASAGRGGAGPGTRPLTPSAAGASLQALADVHAGTGVSWQGIAAANGIDNPRQLQAGQLVDLNLSVRI